MLFIKTGIVLYFAAIAAPQPQDNGEGKSGNGGMPFFNPWQSDSMPTKCKFNQTVVAASGVTGIIGRQTNTGDLSNVAGALTGGDLSNVVGAVTGGDLTNFLGNPAGSV
jgi:hypothetical protein